MRRNKNINRTAYDTKMIAMDQDVYQLRKKVMNVIYEVKRNGYKIPRVEVRIVEDGQEDVMGYAYLNENIVHIKREYTNCENRLVHLVLHEIVHACTGFGHDENCYLMRPVIPMNVNLKNSWKAFSKYF